MKTVKINARIEQKTKEQAENILNELGLNLSNAIKLFLKQIIMNNGLPLEFKIPNKETLKAIQDADNETNLYTANTIDEMFKELRA